MSSTLRTRGIVLRRTNYGEADRIIQLITPEGKRSVMARGVRREKSRLAGGIELFAVSDIVITKGKGDLGILTSARLVEFYRHILDDYDTMQFAYEAVKQVTKASEMVDEPEWYNILQEVLWGLDHLTLPRQLVQLWFYLRYAEMLGHGLSFMIDVEGKSLRESERYRYDVGEKGLQVTPTGELGSDHIKFMRLVSAKPLKTLAQIGGIESILPDCWLVARQHAAI